METILNTGLREIIKVYVLKLFKFSNTHPDIKVCNPISQKDYKSIRRSVRNNLTRAGSYFSVSDSDLRQYLIELGAEFSDK